MFDKILIANRGEIARRIMRTCTEMGIVTVAVYSEADRNALHALEADEAVFIGKSEPAESYLNMDKIIRAARDTGAQAIHPGYGFLAENAAFAQRCEKEGIVFIGPPSKVIRDLGDKIVARQIMEKSGVPIIPGMLQAGCDHPSLMEEAEKIGYPVLIKASAGGGGKGIRIATSPDELEDSCRAASSEAKTAFGDDSIYLEKFFQKAKHVEFQILADSFGNVVHLLERECSVQRRHQKIIEETPSPALNPELREKMGEAAVRAAKASGYVNAGTVEFLLDKDDRFYFLEVNTRLQVEHPITELTTGIDIVRQQILVAAGEKLTISQEDVKARGHSIECRIYAEDPEKDFFPSPGVIEYIKEPAGPGIRNDCGVYSGFDVPVHYDPIISKLIVHAETRDAAVRRMVKALEDYVIIGVKTPIPFMIDVLKSEPFLRGEVYTDFIDEHFADWKPSGADINAALAAYIADEMARNRKFKTSKKSEDEIPSPFGTLGHWRL